MRVLVTGGTGTVGSQVVRELLARRADVQVLTRDSAKIKSLPAGAHAVLGDLLDPKTIVRVFEGADALFLLNAVSQTEASEGLMAVNGARLGRVGRIVYLSVHDADRAPHLPHFGSKLAIEAAVQASGIPFTILRPNNFYQNDVWFRDAILNGVYPQPIGDVGLSRVDVRDIAELAAAALTTADHDGRTYNVVGPELQTGRGTAETWSRVLGRPVAYAGNDLEAWERQSLQYMPGWMVFDFKHMFAHFQEKGLKAAPDDVARLTKALGHAPRRYEAYARETAAAWTR